MGVKIFDVGLSTTPMYMYVINLEKADGGIVVTASHNPAKYNGLRMEGKFATSVGEGSGMERIRDMVLKGKAFFESRSRKCKRFYETGTHKIVKKDYLKKYVNFLSEKFSPEDFYGLTVAIDAGNGMTGMILPEILRKLQIRYFPLYFELDGNFPHHDADPSKPENLRDLSEFIIEKKANIGIAFDGDGDRVGFVGDRGKMVDMDYMTVLLTKFFLEKHPGAKILYDISSSRIVKEAIEENGGKPLLCRTGHSFFRRLIRKKKALFGCEKSGHCLLKEFFFVEAAVLTMLYVLKLLKESGKKIEDLIVPFKKYFFLLETINFPKREKFKAVIKKLESEYSGGILSYLDGLSVEYPDWWFNVRLSNTEPIMRLRIEAKMQEILEMKKKEILGKINIFTK